MHRRRSALKRQARTPGGGTGGGTNGLLPPGTALDNREVLLGSGWSILKETPAPIEGHMYILGLKAGESQVFIENQGSSNKSVDVGSFMGKGGPGELTSEVPDEMAAKA